LSALDTIGRVLAKVFGSRNERLLKHYSRVADRIEALEPGYLAMDDAALRAVTDTLRAKLARGARVEDVLPDAFAALREASRRARNHRQFRCQLIGGQVLFESNIAEMRTGEGKTIVCHLPAYLKVLQGKKVHVVTVNDYLVRRDAEFAAPIFERLGATVGYIQANVDSGGAEGLRRKAYACSITYGTNSEFGFDYLRDNMKVRREDQVQGSLDYAIIDEVDSILIDEARTPLIISGPAHDDVSRYKWADHIARHLVGLQRKADAATREQMSSWGQQPPEDFVRHPKFDGALKRFRVDPSMLNEDEAEALGHRQYFVVQRDRKSVQITHVGVDAAQEEAKIGSFYVGANMDRPHLIENALRAHVVYERDKEYVVQGGDVIIVDEFTGRLMYGRQWSDGLHQAVEAKEGVRVKEETQTLATITIQNYFKLYGSLAGMTGTAITESAEFMKIYKLEVVEIPTNRPVNRVDHNDKIYATTKAKYDAIVEEINEYHRFGRSNDPFVLEGVLRAGAGIESLDSAVRQRVQEALDHFRKADEGDTHVAPVMMEAYEALMGGLVRGRPILVGTTSVEDSERLSELLSRRYGIEHEVLNAKQHAREADIVAKAGYTHAVDQDRRKRGNVTIATNMAGRGTDIKLELDVVNPGCRVPNQDAASVLYPAGTTKCCIHCEEYDPATRCAHCFKPKLDPRFPALGRQVCAASPPCGLHIVGTERHEARRIDNQLRGRSGRQGDPGSSRFFLSLEDDLLKLFMPDWMLKMMARMGFAGGVSLEDRRLSKGIERAQKKVEERNFTSRKHLLEWDEPLNYQRKAFYGQRQSILQGHGIEDLLWKMIADSVRAAVNRFMDENYPARCIADWCRAHLDVHTSADKLTGRDIGQLEAVIRKEALNEARDSIQTSLGEYVDADTPPEEWDVLGLARWAQRAFGEVLTQNQLRRMDPAEIEDWLITAAEQHCAKLELDGIAVYLDPSYGRHQLVEWARNKFGIQVLDTELETASSEQAQALILERAGEAYRRREAEYPVQYITQLAFGDGQGESPYALPLLLDWARFKYGVSWRIEDVQVRPREQLVADLRSLGRTYLLEGRLEQEVDAAMVAHPGEALGEWFRSRFTPPQSEGPHGAALARLHRNICNSQINGALGSRTPTRDEVLRFGRQVLRFELTLLEQFVLLRIYDQAWKDHLLEMDHLKHAIQQRPIAGDQTHPQSQFAIEGKDLFNQMWERIREHVTDRIFKVRLSGEGEAGGEASDGGVPARGPTGGPVQYIHADATGAAFSAAAAAQHAAAMRPQNQPQKVETIRRDVPRVGRNDPCPCGSGKKFKQCHGKR
jgi:preprotein translocase subunit SecA